MKKIAYLVVTVFVAVFLSACGNPVKSDLESFDTQAVIPADQKLNKIAETQTKAFSLMKTAAPEANKLLQESLSMSADAHKLVSAYKAQTDEVKELQKAYLEGLDLINQGNIAAIEGIRNNDRNAYNNGRTVASKGMLKYNVAVVKFNKLADEHKYQTPQR